MVSKSKSGDDKVQRGCPKFAGNDEWGRCLCNKLVDEQTKLGNETDSTPVVTGERDRSCVMLMLSSGIKGLGYDINVAGGRISSKS